MEFPFQMQQFPEELDWLTSRLLRAGVRTILTIGVYTGGVEWWLATHYNRPLHITCVDIVAHPAFVETQKLIKEQAPQATVEFLHKNIRDCQHLGFFDAVFVDGGHTAEDIQHDAMFAIDRAYKLVAFHDIAGNATHTSPVREYWKVLQEVYEHDYFISHPEQDKGIGIIYL